jgi:hypothetical protein
MLQRLRLKDWLGVAFGAWIFVSPWMLRFDSALAAGLNGVVTGSLMVAYAIASMWRGMLAGPDDRRANPP